MVLDSTKRANQPPPEIIEENANVARGGYFIDGIRSELMEFINLDEFIATTVYERINNLLS